MYLQAVWAIIELEKPLNIKSLANAFLGLDAKAERWKIKVAAIIDKVKHGSTVSNPNNK